MLRANSRQFFNYKMKGRRARIRNQKRSIGYHRSLDNYDETMRLRRQFRQDVYDSFFSTPKKLFFWTVIIVWLMTACQY